MSLEVCSEHMQGILGFLNKPAAQAAAFVQSVYGKCYWMKPERFVKVCGEVENELSPGRLPTYQKFKVCYDRLADTLNWKSQDAATRKVCGVCKDFGWVYVRLTQTATGITDNFNKPCPDCRSNHPYAGMPLRDGWIEDEMVTAAPAVIQPLPGVAKFLSSTYEDIDPGMSPEDALEMFKHLRKEGILKVRKNQKNIFAEVVIASQRSLDTVENGPSGEGEIPGDPTERGSTEARWGIKYFDGDQEGGEEEGELPPI